MSTPTGESETSPPGEERRYPDGRHREHRTRSAFVPILVIAIAFLIWSGFQTIMLVRESNALGSASDTQAAQKKNADKLRQALDGLARDTAKLADRGNPGARLIVEELRKRGVTINPEAPAPAPAK
jgi:hypothetical protein